MYLYIPVLLHTYAIGFCTFVFFPQPFQCCSSGLGTNHSISKCDVPKTDPKGFKLSVFVYSINTRSSIELLVGKCLVSEGRRLRKKVGRTYVRTNRYVDPTRLTLTSSSMGAPGVKSPVTTSTSWTSSALPMALKSNSLIACGFIGTVTTG